MNQQITDRVEELKKSISTLEWDISHIQNKKLKAHKERGLRDYKSELRGLLDKLEAPIEA